MYWFSSSRNAGGNTVLNGIFRIPLSSVCCWGDIACLSFVSPLNRIIALPYKLMLPMLARRIAYAGLHVQDPDYGLALSCERQTLRQFFGTTRPR